MLTRFGNRIWLSDGPDVTVAGFHYPTRMAIIALSNGELAVWSPIALTEDLKKEVDALGQVAHIVPPNSLHHLSLTQWREAYPDATLYAPRRLRSKRKDLTFDADLEDGVFGTEIRIIYYETLITDEAIMFHAMSKTALFTDLLQDIPRDRLTGWRAMVAGLDLMATGTPTVPRKFRLATVKRRNARGALRRLFVLPIDKVLIAHGNPVESNGVEYLARAFSWLTKGPYKNFCVVR